MAVLLEYIDQTTFWKGLGSTTPEFGHATALYTRASTILKILSLTFNSLLIIYVCQAHDKLVDKLMFTTLLTQLKAAVLVKVPQNYLLKPNCLTQIT